MKDISLSIFSIFSRLESLIKRPLIKRGSLLMIPLMSPSLCPLRILNPIISITIKKTRSPRNAARLLMNCSLKTKSPASIPVSTIRTFDIVCISLSSTTVASPVLKGTRSLTYIALRGSPATAPIAFIDDVASPATLARTNL